MIVAMSWKMVMNAPNCTGGNTAGAGLDGLSKPLGVRRCMCAMSWRCRIPVCYFFRYGHGGAARFQGCIWNTAQTTALRASASCVDLRTGYKCEEGELKVSNRDQLQGEIAQSGDTVLCTAACLGVMEANSCSAHWYTIDIVKKFMSAIRHNATNVSFNCISKLIEVQPRLYFIPFLLFPLFRQHDL
jgi:hypothetical protein